MPPDHQQLIGEVTAQLSAASDVAQACQLAVTALGGHSPARISVLLRVHDRLRCVAATGSWQIFATVPPGAGVVSRAYAAGRTEIVPSVRADPDYLCLRPDVTTEICAPLLDPAGRPIGVLDVEWTSPVGLDSWRATTELIAARLSRRIEELGGPPGESRSEKLLRHASALTAAPTERDLLTATIAAARDVTGLSTALPLLVESPEATPLDVVPPEPGLATRILDRLHRVNPAALHRLLARIHERGASYTLAEAGSPAIADHAPLVAAGVGTLIAVPVGPVEAGGVLIVADERTLRPDPTTVNLIELLAGQTWLCLDRLRRLAVLQRQAASDPLTGLRHQGSFGQRIATATPDRTALLAIDVDGFKLINDTYGHQVGDRVLVDLTRALKTALRSDDELFRIGGDEFVAVVEVLRADEALGIAERLAAAARRTGRTISVGVALRRDGESPEVTLRRADAALYDAKREGRDAVRLSF